MPDIDQQQVGEAVFAKLEGLKGQHAETAVELKALLPSILDQAFKREL